MTDATNPYAATTETEPSQVSSGEWLRTFGISLLWIGIAVVSTIARSTMLPMFEDFGVQLPIVTLIAISRFAIAFSLLAAVIVFLTLLMDRDHRLLRPFLNAALVAAIVVFAIFVFALVMPMINLMGSLS